MNTIKDLQAVKDWAKEIYEGEGKKYTALSKSDQYEIARAIYFAYCPQKSEVVEEEPPSPVEQPVEEEIIPKPNPLCDVMEMPLGKPQVETEEDERMQRDRVEYPIPSDPSPEPLPAPSPIVTRWEYYHKLGKLPQEAFDEFSRYCADHPKERSIIDFQTGQKSSFAAFAYWLGGQMGETLTPVKRKSKDVMNDWDT